VLSTTLRRLGEGVASANSHDQKANQPKKKKEEDFVIMTSLGLGNDWTVHPGGKSGYC